jgi:hypothetical protein
LEFLYHIDKLTRGNLTSIAVGRREVLNDGLYGSAVERKLNPELGVTGREVAEAIILNCSLGNLQEAKKKAQAVNPDTVTIKDVLSKEVFLRIISGNRATLDRFSEEATETSKIANTLLETLEKFLAHLEDVNNELDKSNEVPVENYFLKDEMRTWMNFLVDFTLRFMNYRIDMIHVIIRVIKILNVKSHNRLNEKQSSLGYGQQYNSFLGGPIQVYRDNIFNEMSYPQLVKVSKYISDLQQRNMMYNSKAGLPIYVIPVKDGKDKIKDGLYQRYTGWATPIFKNDDKPFKEIGQRLLEFTCNEQKLITLFNTMSFNKGNPDEDLIGALIFADINDYNITTKEFKSFFPACIHYYAIIIHEVTHAVQNNIEIRKRVDYLNLGKSEINDNISEKIKEYKKKNHNYNKQESTAKTYHLNNKEAEAFKAQYNFYMTTLEDKPNAYQKDARNILIKNIFNRI